MTTPRKRTTRRVTPASGEARPDPVGDAPNDPDEVASDLTAEPESPPDRSEPDAPGDMPPQSKGRPRGRGKVARKHSLREPVARMWMGGAQGVGFMELATGELPVYAPVLMAHTASMSEAIDACAQESDWFYRFLAKSGGAGAALQLGGALYALVNDLIDAKSARKKERDRDNGSQSTWDGGATPNDESPPAGPTVEHVSSSVPLGAR